MKIILGIDPGFDRAGIAIISKDKGKEKYLFSTCRETNRKEDINERIFKVANELEKIIKEYKPEELSIEKIFLSNNQKTAMHIAEVRGVCIYIAKKNNLKIFEYSPPEIKVAITGYGKANKEDICKMVGKIIKIEKKDVMLDDELDALAIALTHSAIVRN